MNRTDSLSKQTTSQPYPQLTGQTQESPLKRGGFLLLFVLILLFSTGMVAQDYVRTPINIPDIPGYITLKCDFHMHTVFSDGEVSPALRCAEAWCEGLDAIALSDHIEDRYHTYKEDIQINRNRPYELALEGAGYLGLLYIKAGEITRPMPPGHINAIFLKDVEAVANEDFDAEIKAAADQGAFIFHNHPGWKGQQKDGVSRWYSIHTELYEKKLLHGIEIVNGPEYYADAHQWALDKNLAIVGNSDAHDPLSMYYDFNKGEHRTMTLVFAKDKSIAAIEEALRARRTAVYWENSLIGSSQYLEPLFKQSTAIINPMLTLTGKYSSYLQIHNTSCVPFELELTKEIKELSVPANITLYPGKTVLFRVRSTTGEAMSKKSFTLPYRVKNLIIAPGQGLPVTIEFQAIVQAETK